MSWPQTFGRKSLAEFLLSRWRGQVPLGRLFWRDMIVAGTIINLAISVFALLALGAGLPLAAALAVHLLPLPYNLFLFIAVWTTAGRRPFVIAVAYQLAATVWLVFVTVA
ncbi:hypothetical protein ACHMW4_13500 [Mesorhizobium sp. UC22_110]|uniref:hypothetical protein n=1 Tax=unclassified Mesorhizobium TaxID=325217 RepID=UPI003672AB43